MKLHHLTVQAFGPFADCQQIDFDILNGSGLFLLEGPTGSGKSTVLDAITFALYAGLAGSEAGKDRLHSDHADPGVQPFVELEFSVRGRRWKVRRVPEHERPKMRGTGTTTDNGSVHLTRLEAGEWVSVSSSHAEVGDILGEELGLTKDQFTQVVLLPQGEFANFLQAKDDERRKVLTKIFGTWIYEAITRQLESQRTELKRRVETAQQDVRNALSIALEAAGHDRDLDPSRMDELMAGSAEERAAYLDRVEHDLKARLGEARKAEASRHSDLLAAQEQAKLSDQLEATLLALKRAADELAAHEATRADIDGVIADLALASKAAPVEPLLQQLDGLEEEAEKAQQAVLLHDQVLVERIVRDGLEQSEKQAQSEDAAAAALGHLVDLEAGLAERRGDLSRRKDEIAASDAAVAEREVALQALPESIAALDQQLNDARVVAAGLADAQAQRAALSGRFDAARAAEKLAEDVASAAQRARGAEELRIRFVDTHQQLLQRRLDGIAAELAGRLTPGDACPVCGSTEHPAPALAGEEAVSADDVERAAERRGLAETAEREAKKELEALEKERNQHLVLAGGKGSTTLAGELTHQQQRESECRQAEESVEPLQAERTALAMEQVEGDRELAEDKKHLAEAQVVLTKDELSLNVDVATVEQARGGHPSVAARQQALRDYARRLRAAIKAVEARDRAAADAERMRAQVTDTVRQAGFPGAPEARQALRSEDDRERMSREVEDWREEFTRRTTQVQREEYAGLDVDGLAAARKAALEASAANARAQAAWEQAHAEHSVVSERAERFGQQKPEVVGADAALASAREAAAPVARLAALANGTTGHKRMTLTTYVLRQWFVRVVEAANLRLDRMSSGRYHLERVEQGDRKDDRVGLGLHVVDRYTGKSRSTKSMSGGETFYTSLALALGLADVVRAEAGGVELDTMFIDEGFGSLDPERLEEVMGVIDELRDGNRTVGIVSHVAELKERITERVEVRRSSDVGSSYLKVVA